MPSILHPIPRPAFQTRASIPIVPLGQWPTPIERVEVDGRPIWLKRDDLSGFGRGGAKTRKIEPLLGFMIEKGYDELVTVAGNVTNLAFDLIPACDLAGVRLKLFISDDPPTPVAARREIFTGVLDQVDLIGDSRLDALRRCRRHIRARRKAGANPLLLFPGASHPTALAGNAIGFQEMLDQFEGMGESPPSHVFVSFATGTTLGGFLLAAPETTAVIGVQVYPGHATLRLRAMLRWTENRYELDRFPRNRIHIDRSLIQRGFGEFTRETVESIKHCPVSLDPIFGGKTWRVMLETLPGLPDDATVLFWHCGTTPEWETIGRERE